MERAQGARGSLHALMSGADRGELALSRAPAQASDATAAHRQQEAVAQHLTQDGVSPAPHMHPVTAYIKTRLDDVAPC